jgi:membrane associated rhomboid family serine protease
VFPIRDENPTARRPLATAALVVLNAASWLYLQGLGSTRPLAASLCHYGLIPGDLFGIVEPGTRVELGEGLACVLDGQGAWVTVLTSMFMHGGWFHLIGNMWFLWIFGDNVEDAMGRLRFLVFYLLCGIAAAAAQAATDPTSSVPMVGASGAIGGVMGAYWRLFPRAHVHTLLVLGFYVTTLSLPASFMLGYWFLIQIAGGLPSLTGLSGGVAFWAHVGGFLAGVLLVGAFRRPELVAAHLAQGERRTARHRVGRW